MIRLEALGFHFNPIDGCQCSNELRAQLNLTNDQKGRVTIPASMSCAWKSHVAAVSKLSSSNPKKNVVAASVYKPFDVWQKWWVPGTVGSGFNTSTDRVKPERNEATRRPVAQHIDSRQGENRNMASQLFHFT